MSLSFDWKCREIIKITGLAFNSPLYNFWERFHQSLSGWLKFFDSSFLLTSVNFNRALTVGIHLELTSIFLRHCLKTGALWRSQNNQRFILLCFVHGLAYVYAVLVGDVMILPQFFVFEDHGLYLSVQFFNGLIVLFLLFGQILVFLFQIVNVFL